MRVLRKETEHKIGFYVRISSFRDTGFLGKDPRNVALRSLNKAVFHDISVENA